MDGDPSTARTSSVSIRGAEDSAGHRDPRGEALESFEHAFARQPVRRPEHQNVKLTLRRDPPWHPIHSRNTREQSPILASPQTHEARWLDSQFLACPSRPADRVQFLSLFLVIIEIFRDGKSNYGSHRDVSRCAVSIESFFQCRWQIR